MTITKFDKATCRQVAPKVLDALKPLAESLGLSIRYAGGSYSDGVYTAKVEFGVMGGNGLAASREGEAFKELAHFYGLAADDLGKTFEHRGEKWTIIGLASRSEKFPLIVQRTRDGKRFKMSADPAAAAFGKRTATAMGSVTPQPEGTGICSNDHKLLPGMKTGQCKAKATTFRMSERWGEKGEPVMVKVRLPLCADCAKAWDDNRAEARAEARVS